MTFSKRAKALTTLTAAVALSIGTFTIATSGTAAPRVVPASVDGTGSMYPSPTNISFPSGKPTVRPCRPRPCAITPLPVARR